MVKDELVADLGCVRNLCSILEQHSANTATEVSNSLRIVMSTLDAIVERVDALDIQHARKAVG